MTVIVCMSPSQEEFFGTTRLDSLCFTRTRGGPSPCRRVHPRTGQHPREWPPRDAGTAALRRSPARVGPGETHTPLVCRGLTMSFHVSIWNFRPRLEVALTTKTLLSFPVTMLVRDCTPSQRASEASEQATAVR